MESVTYLRIAHDTSLDSALMPRPTGANVVIGGNRGEALLLDPCPWPSNGHCEGSPLDDLCALDLPDCLDL